jgi:hypothetical protein
VKADVIKSFEDMKDFIYTIEQYIDKPIIEREDKEDNEAAPDVSA